MKESELNQIQNMKALYIIEPFLLPLLQKRHEAILGNIYNKFISGETNFLSEVAQLCEIKNIILELERVKNLGSRATKKQDLE